jgi:SAM-dependent methyltransferase
VIAEPDQAVRYQAAQLAHTRFRRALVDLWDIPAGARVLEIGCGFGDTTAVLADAVGPGGRVVAVDIEDKRYGDRFLIGQSAERLKASQLGDRIEFRFGWAPESLHTSKMEFDYVVIAHASWSFHSLAALQTVLEGAGNCAPVLCFSEWDLRPRTLAQAMHSMAAIAQGTFEPERARIVDGNIRTPLSRQRSLTAIIRCGWKIRTDVTVDSTALDTGANEVAMCRMALDMPDLTGMLASQFDVIDTMIQSVEPTSLYSFAVTAGPGVPPALQ